MFNKNSIEYFVDVTDFAIYCAKAQVSGGDATVCALEEIPTGDIAAIRESLKAFFGSKRGAYTQAYCTFRAPSAFVRKASLEAPARARDPEYLKQLLVDDYGINPQTHDVHVLNGPNGKPFDPDVSLQRDLIFCGATHEDIERNQQFLVQIGIYPKALELCSLNMLASILDYTAMESLPTLALEIQYERSLAFIIQKGAVELIRPIPFGINHLIPLIQKELDLEDEQAARELLFSNTFDFTENGPTLLSKLFKELQTSVDYFEVQTGQSVGSSFISALPESLSWISKAVEERMSTPPLTLDFPRWLALNNIEMHEDISPTWLQKPWFGTLGLVASHITQTTPAYS